MADSRHTNAVAQQIFVPIEEAESAAPESEQDDDNWTEVLCPKRHWFDFRLKELWQYRDLIWLFVRRDFVAQYKQTVLGPAWFFLAPLFTMLSFNFVFSQVAQISTDGIPGPLFHLAGITIWNYFQGSFSSTSGTLNNNASIFGKVYFPRLAAPLSVLISNLSKLGIQMMMFLIFWGFHFHRGTITITSHILLSPFLMILVAGIALGTGLIISALTAKYRDFSYLIGFGLNLLMFLTPVAYPASAIPEKYKTLLMLNPIAPIIEAFRYGWTGAGAFSWGGLWYSTLFMSVSLLVGLIAFNQTEKNFIDTV